MFHLKLLFNHFLFRKLFGCFFILFLLLLMLPNSIKAQPCPPTINDPGWSQSQMASFEIYPYDSWGYVNFIFRDFGGRYEIKVDWTTLSNNGKYGITDDELKQIMHKAVIALIAGRKCENLQGQKQFVFFEETECKVTKNCYLHLIKNQEIYCRDDGWPGPDPDYLIYDDEHYYKLSKEFVCGTQCCEFVYTVECALNPQGVDNYAHIISFSKNPFPGSSCPAGQDTDCLTGEPKPCVSTCN